MEVLLTTIELYGVIGIDIPAQHIISQLSPGAAIRLHINSAGGLTSDAWAIYNRLVAHTGKVTVVVDGLAASAATIIAMGADRIEMPENATFMLHNPWTAMQGDADELRTRADRLDEEAGRMARVYASRSGLDLKRVQELMRAETYLSAAEAKRYGFVDVVTSASKQARALVQDATHAYYLARGMSQGDMPLAAFAPPPGLNPRGLTSAELERDALRARLQELQLGAVIEAEQRGHTYGSGRMARYLGQHFDDLEVADMIRIARRRAGVV